MCIQIWTRWKRISKAYFIYLLIDWFFTNTPYVLNSKACFFFCNLRHHIEISHTFFSYHWYRRKGKVGPVFYLIQNIFTQRSTEASWWGEEAHRNISQLFICTLQKWQCQFTIACHHVCFYKGLKNSCTLVSWQFTATFTADNWSLLPLTNFGYFFFFFKLQRS